MERQPAAALELRERRHVFEEERLVGWQTVKAHSVYN